MSSTNRGGQREASDYYVTPSWAIRQFLEAFREDTGINYADLRILDPCAGGFADAGVVRPCAYPEVLSEFGAGREVTSVDIRPDSAALIQRDFLDPDFLAESTAKFDLVVTNPPFSLALPIIQRSLEVTRYGGHVAMLLRLNFFGSKDRQPFFAQFMPARCYVHSRRIPFSGKTSTDSIEYAHFVWEKGNNPKACALRLLPYVEL